MPLINFKTTLFKSGKSEKLQELLDRQRRVVVPYEEVKGYRWMRRKFGHVGRKRKSG